MARKVDIEYIRYYSDDNLARKIEPLQPFKLPEWKPRVRKKKKIRVYIDPVATAGVLVAAVMLVLMVVGVYQLKTARQEAVDMERYVSWLQTQNEQLQATYEEGYDLETVERLALALGMVPVEELPNIPVQLPAEPEVVEPTLWENICAFFTELFA